jgi:hypothetical protein
MATIPHLSSQKIVSDVYETRYEPGYFSYTIT